MKYQELWQQFVTPANTYRLAPLFRINDTLDREQVFRQVKALKEQGCGGLFTLCEHLEKQFPAKFLAPEWWGAVELCVEACVQEGLDVWVYDEQDWPSGTCGGQIAEHNPAMGWKYLAPIEQDVAGPAPVTIEIGGGTFVSAVALQLDGHAVVEGSVQDLTARVADGRLVWNAPAGRWRVAVYTWQLGQGGVWGPNSSDLMDPQVGRKFVEMSYQAHWEAVRRVPGGKLLGYFTDEPIYSLGLYRQDAAPTRPAQALPWTPGLLAAFQQQHGYDLRPHLPDLFYDGGRQAVQTRCHFFATCSHLFSESYFGEIYRFCEKLGVQATGHLNGEEMFTMHPGSQGGNHLMHYRYMHIPGIDWVFPRSSPLPAVVPKYAASIAHLLGRERTWCESFAGAGWGMSFRAYLRTVNWEHVNGINMQIPITYKYSLRGPNRVTFFSPGITYQQPYWRHFRAFADYEARLCALTAGGGHVAQVALFYPALDIQVHFRELDLLDRKGKDFANLGDRLRYAGYDFDIFDDQILLTETAVALGQLKTTTETFAVLVIPPMDVFRRDTLAKVREFVRAGGRVIFIGTLPRHSVEAGADDPELRRLLAELLGADCHHRIACHTTWHDYGAGRAGLAPDAAAAVALLRRFASPDVQAGPEAAGLVACHRRLDDGDLYLLFNDTDQARTLTLTLAASGHPERWNLLDGAAEGVAGYEISAQGTTLSLLFHPRQLVPLFLHREAARVAPVRKTALLREWPVPGPFRFRVEETMARPEVAWNFAEDHQAWKSKAAPLQVPATIALGDWSKLGLPYFSGIGLYETEVTLEPLPAGTRVVLALGRVCLSAEVTVNGQRAGVVLFDPYEIDITDQVIAGRNRLSIGVANTLANYYAQFEGLDQKEPYLGGMVPEDQVSGLLGPVTLKFLAGR